MNYNLHGAKFQATEGGKEGVGGMMFNSIFLFRNDWLHLKAATWVHDVVIILAENIIFFFFLC